MATPTNHFKLGLFVILSVSCLVGAGIVFGASRMKKDTVKYHTYFNESVQGLDVGSPVKFRGVTLGFVSAIEIAPDHRHVDVVEELDIVDIKRMGLAEKEKSGLVTTTTHFLIPPDLRAQLGSQGITGVKFISIDFFDPKGNPPPDLPFETPALYIPAAPSMMKNLEDTVSKAMESLPDLVASVVGIMSRVDRMIGQLEKDDVTGKAVATLTHADGVLTGLNHTLGSIDQAGLPNKAASALDDVRKAVAKMNAMLEKVDGPNGLLASVQHTSDSFGNLGKGATSTTRELDATLREVREAAEGIRVLADALERDPDMLLKGRGKAKNASERR